VPAGQLQLPPTPSSSPSQTATANPTASVLPERSSETPTPPPPPDATIEQEIEKALHSDSAIADLDISTIVEAGRVTIVGSVRSPEMKQRVARTIRAINGVTSIDNQLVVIEATPS
jgi:hypothetical protein